MTAKALEVPSFVADMHLVSDFADITAALRSGNLRSNRDEYGSLFMGRTLAAIDGAEHLARRRMENSVVTGAALHHYEKQMLRPLLEEYFAHCRTQAGPDGVLEVDLVDAGLYLLIRIGALIAGIDGISTEDDARGLLRYVDAHATGGALEWSKLPPEQHAAVLKDCLALRDRFETEMYQPSLARRRALVDEHHAGRLEAAELPKDILTSLLLGHRDDWDDQLPLREVCVYLTASIRTSTRILTNTVAELARWFEHHPHDRSLVENPDLLRDAVGEALRLHPVLPAMIRKCVGRIELPSGDVIEAGESVAFLFAQANRDPAVFGEDADEYDPHRQHRLPAGSPVYGLAFGAGQHICMGRRLAYGGTYTGDPDQDFIGTVNTLVEAFSQAGVTLNPTRPPVPNQDSFYDEFLTFPVRLTALHTASHPGAES